MAGNDTIATLGVDLVGRDISASATIDKVKGKAEAAAVSMRTLGDTAQHTTEKMTKGSTEAANGFVVLGRAATTVQSTVSKILIPLALISTLTSAIALMLRFGDAAKRAKEELDKLNQSAKDLRQTQIELTRGHSDATIAALQLHKELEAGRAELLKSQLDQVDTISILRRELGSLGASAKAMREADTEAIGGWLDRLHDQANAVQRVNTETIKLFQQRQKDAEAAAKAAEDQAAADEKRAAALAKMIEHEERLASKREAAASRIASIEQQIFDLQTSRLEADERAIAVAQRRLDLAIEAAAAEDNAQGYAKAIQLVFELQDLLKQLRAEQAKAVGDEAVERFKAEQELHRTRMKNLEEFERKLRESLGGGIFGEGAVAGGNIGALTSAISQIADKLGGAR